MTQRATAAHRTKYVLDEADLPPQWYNMQAGLKTPAPPVLHRAPMKHAEYREQVIKRQIRLMHKRGIWVKPER